MQTMIVNGNRYLINDQSKGCDEVCAKILEMYPSDAVIDFDNVKPIDYERTDFIKRLLEGNRTDGR